MKKQEYTLEEISYSRKEDRRIMERVLNGWFKDPKALNFTAPGFSFPFKFSIVARMLVSLKPEIKPKTAAIGTNQ